MEPFKDAKEFDSYIQESRDEFVTKFWEQWPDAKERVTAENLLICFDQMRDRLLRLQADNDSMDKDLQDIANKNVKELFSPDK